MTRVLLVHARSPLHAGTGQSTGAVDLPIARDRATDLPLLPGSSLKGALRARGTQQRNPQLLSVFGPETTNASVHAGAVAFSDARLLLLPVRSVAGTFAWVTSPLLIAALARDARLAGVTLPACPTVQGAEFCEVSRDCALITQVNRVNAVVLEEFDLRVEPGRAEALGEALAKLVFPDDPTWQALLRRRLCVVHDDVLTFLARHATEIVTRVSIDPQTGTAKDGQLWTEENLPAETVLVSLVEVLPTERIKPGVALEVLQALTAEPIQLGGKATVGRGRCQLQLHGGGT